MKLMVTAATALHMVTAGPPLTGPDLDRALRNYRAMLAGQTQFVDLSIRERDDVIELDRWLRSQPATAASGTKEHCAARLGSRSPSGLEAALIDLKCSQRPSERQSEGPPAPMK